MGLASFEGPSPGKRAHLSPDTHRSISLSPVGGSVSVMVHTGRL